MKSAYRLPFSASLAVMPPSHPEGLLTEHKIKFFGLIKKRKKKDIKQLNTGNWSKDLASIEGQVIFFFKK